MQVVREVSFLGACAPVRKKNRVTVAGGEGREAYTRDIAHKIWCLRPPQAQVLWS